MAQLFTIKSEVTPLSYTTFAVLLFMAVTVLLQPLSSAAPRNAPQGCTIPTVQEHEQTTLTCRFDGDLRLSKKDVKVLQYGVQTEVNTVMVCLWHFGTPKCIVHPGYTFDGNITDELRIQIPDATQDHVGTYACDVSDSKPDILKVCTFVLVETVQDEDEDASSFPVGCPIDGNNISGKSGCRETKAHYLFPVVIAASVLVTVLIIIGIIVLIVCTHKSCLRRRTAQKTADQDKQPILQD